MQEQVTEMKRQVTEMGQQTGVLQKSVAAAEKSADAANLNAQTVINAERAWVDISFIRTAATKYEFRVTNIGKSPAFITARTFGRGYWAKDVKVIPVGHPGHQVETATMYHILPVREKPTNILNFDIATYPTGENGQTVTYHGHVAYRDIFGQEHQTELVYSLHQFLGDTGARLVGLPQYTRYVTTTKDGEKAN
jgi:hypothetical protein